MGGIGNAVLAPGNVSESIAYTREATAILEETIGPSDRRTLSEVNNLMLALANDNQLAEAESLGRELLSAEKRRSDPTTSRRRTPVTISHVYCCRRASTQKHSSLRVARCNQRTRFSAPPNYRTLYLTNNLGIALEGTGQLDLAESTLRTTLELRRKIHGDLNSSTQRTMACLARLLLRREKPEGTQLFRELIGLRRGRKSLDPTLDRDLERVPDVLAEHADPTIAEPILREMLGALERTFWPGDWCTAHVQSLLGGCLARQGRKSEATPLLKESLRAMEAAKISPGPILEGARKRLQLTGETSR